MTKIEKQRAVVCTGSVVAFRTGSSAVWFDVVKTHGDFGLEVKEHGTSNASSLIDRCYVEQVKAA